MHGTLAKAIPSLVLRTGLTTGEHFSVKQHSQKPERSRKNVSSGTEEMAFGDGAEHDTRRLRQGYGEPWRRVCSLGSIRAAASDFEARRLLRQNARYRRESRVKGFAPRGLVGLS